MHRLCFDSLAPNEKEKALDFVKKNCAKCYDLVSRYIHKGAKLEVTEDLILV
ncbi:MAG TPA: hypothetical protein VFF30_14785 [Nitrososphaerales archaeon]|nr:hypothetical protein [Nitrososphaerales archaeon]